MKISARDEYACSAVLELALHYDSESPIRVQDIAERQGIPMKFLFQIMQILKRIDIVRSRRGTEGGYTLTRSPAQITVGEVIRAMSGPFVQLSCLDSGNFDVYTIHKVTPPASHAGAILPAVPANSHSLALRPLGDA